MASVGTKVSAMVSRYEASIANTTASAKGINKYRATPVRKNIGRNTMQMHKVETNAGTAICRAPSRIAVAPHPDCARDSGVMFSISTVCVVYKDSDRQRQASQRHDVDGFPQSAEYAD